MNVTMFLLPKNETVFLVSNITMRQALEKMEYHRYSAIPIISQDGKYQGTVTEGDLLWKIKNTPGLDFKATEKIPLKDVPLRMDNKPVTINAQIEDLITHAIDQNFIPIIDDQGIYVGIVRRREILEYCKTLIDNTKIA
ncbi:MAG: CBS domain-containing protein [Bacillota bacterium]|nr:CBS domain-containing protein [Bacillota bacterium]